MGIIFLIFGFWFFISPSFAVDEDVDLHSLFRKEAYRPKNSESHIARAVVSVFNEASSGKGTAFFISPNQLVTNFHVICCSDAPVSEFLFIFTDRDTKQKRAISKVIYADAYNDLVVLEIDDFSVEHFLELDEADDIQVGDRVRGFGYIADYPNIVRLEGNIVSVENTVYGSIFNVYQLSGVSGAPILGEEDNKVKAVVFGASTNLGLLISAREIQELMKREPCTDSRLCQDSSLRTLFDLADGGDAHAQYTLGALQFRLASLLPRSFDEEDTVMWWYLAAEQGHKVAMNNVGAFLSALDIADGLEWIRRAAEEGDIPAIHSMGLHYWFNLKQGENSFKQAEHYLKNAASQGYVSAQLDLCQFYYEYAKAADRDKKKEEYQEKALKWCRNAAREYSHPGAVGMMLEILTN